MPTNLNLMWQELYNSSGFCNFIHTIHTMKKYFLPSLLSTAFLLSLCFILPGNEKKKEEKIKWRSFSEAVELNKKKPKKIFIDVYTDWCGWCKKMDGEAFQNEAIAKYINEKYYAVKLNAEMKDTVIFNNFTFVNPNPANPRSVHQLAASLLNNKMTYPTGVYMDENFGILQALPGYLDPKTFEMVLKFFGDEANKTTSWEDFQKSFNGEVK